MKMLFRAHSTLEDYNADCDYALVDLTPAVIRSIKKLRRIARMAVEADSLVHQIRRLLATEVKFYELYAVGDDALAAVDDVGWLVLTDEQAAAIETHEPEPVESQQMIIDVSLHTVVDGHYLYEVSWEASPTNTDFYVQSSSIDSDELLRLVEGKSCPTT